MGKRPHGYYPQVELPEHEFLEVLDLVDALDPQQLLRLYCKVGSKVGPHVETIPGAKSRDTTSVFRIEDDDEPLPPVLEIDAPEDG